MASKRTLHDQYFKKAKSEGYAARSAYKLIEIAEKKKLLRRGDRVLDLGCAPGSWIQAALNLIGDEGFVVGIDLNRIKIPLPSNAVALVGDAFEIDPADLMAPIGGMFDVVVSDMAPNTSGHGDHFKSVELCRRVLELCDSVLRAGGNLTMKVFEGEAYRDLLDETSQRFGQVKGFKPRASRDVSSEMYIVAHTFEPAHAAKP